MVCEKLFLASVRDVISSKDRTRKLYSAAEYETFEMIIRRRNEGLPLEDKNDYRKVKQFQIEEVDNVTRLKHTQSGKILIRTEDYYNVLSEAHEKTVHGGINVMLKYLRGVYFNIHRDIVSKFIALCEVCELKRNKVHHHEVVKPILTDELNGRCQVDLIDYQSRPDGEYKFVLVYQDHLTKYVILRALKTKTMETIVKKLFPIFIDFGAPTILHTDNGKEFNNMLIEAFTEIWPNCKLLHGKPRHSQSQGSVERANQDVEKKIACWMTDHKSTNWAKGLPFVQYAKNRCFHEGIGCTPFQAMFGIECRNDLEKLALPVNVTSTLNDEDDLERITGKNNVRQSKVEDMQKSSTCTAECSLGDDHNTEELLLTKRPFTVDKESEVENVLAKKLRSFEEIREKCRRRQTKQAETMLQRTKKKAAMKVAVGTSVRVPVPLVDRAKSDQRNIIAIVIKENKNNCYVLGTKCGILEGAYSTNQFEKCKGGFLKVTEVPKGKCITLREAAGLSSVGGTSQGFVKCSCKKLCGPKCTCVTKNMVCNSKCHKNFTCGNRFNK